MMFQMNLLKQKIRALTLILKKEVIETKKTSNTNRLTKMKSMVKISRYSLSSIKVQRSLKEIKKIKNDDHDLAEEKFKLEDLKVVIQEYIEQFKRGETKFNFNFKYESSQIG